MRFLIIKLKNGETVTGYIRGDTETSLGEHVDVVRVTFIDGSEVFVPLHALYYVEVGKKEDVNEIG